jgi:hypothetical protein
MGPDTVPPLFWIELNTSDKVTPESRKQISVEAARVATKKVDEFLQSKACGQYS